MDIRLLHEDGHSVRADEAGEIYISGPGVSLGYLDDPAETKRRFLRMADDGTCNSGGSLCYKTGDLGRFQKESKPILEYVGRNDRQVKHNNYMVELGEVGAVVKQGESVLNAHVVHLEDLGNRLQDVLVAFVLPYNQRHFQPHAVREFVRSTCQHIWSLARSYLSTAFR